MVTLYDGEQASRVTILSFPNKEAFIPAYIDMIYLSEV